MKGLDKFKQDFESNILVHLQNPFALRLVVLAFIGLAGLGGIGTSLYMKLTTLYVKNQEQLVRKSLIREHQDLKQTVSIYSQRLSPNTEYIEWVRDLREMCRQANLSVASLNPSLTTSKDPTALRQLKVEMNLSGEYLDMLKLLGRFENDKIRINVTDISIQPVVKKKGEAIIGYMMNLKLAILMQPLSAKKETKDKTPKAAEHKSETENLAVSSATLKTEAPVKNTAVPVAKSSQTVESKAAAPVLPAVKVSEPKLPEAQQPAASSSSKFVEEDAPPAQTQRSSKFSGENAAPAPETKPASKFGAPETIAPAKGKHRGPAHGQKPAAVAPPPAAAPATESGGSSKFANN